MRLVKPKDSEERKKALLPPPGRLPIPGPKKYCRRCGDRVSRKARRCPYCNYNLKLFSTILFWVIFVAIGLAVAYLVTEYGQ